MNEERIPEILNMKMERSRSIWHQQVRKDVTQREGRQ
jgi:hypothetical protein